MCLCTKSFESCVIPCDPMDCSPPASGVHRILQARILECVDVLSSRESARPRDWTLSLMFMHWQVGPLPPEKPKYSNIKWKKILNTPEIIFLTFLKHTSAVSNSSIKKLLWTNLPAQILAQVDYKSHFHLFIHAGFIQLYIMNIICGALWGKKGKDRSFHILLELSLHEIALKSRFIVE